MFLKINQSVMVNTQHIVSISHSNNEVYIKTIDGNSFVYKGTLASLQRAIKTGGEIIVEPS